MKHGKSWKDGSSILALLFVGQDLEVLQRHLSQAGFSAATALKGGRVYSTDAMRACVGSTDGNHPAFMDALRAAVAEIRAGMGDYFEGW